MNYTKKPIKEEDKSKIIDLYKLGSSIKSLSSTYNISEFIIKKFLVNSNIILRTRREVNLRTTTNEEFFKTIDSEEKAYWLGYLYADGNISKTKRDIYTISLTSIDQEVLENFQKSIQTTRQIKWCNGQDKWKNAKPIGTLSVNSQTMFEDLEKKGCIRNKTFLLQYPSYSIIPKELQRHFIRGYFDGDGSVSTYYTKTNPNYHSINIHICGIKSFLTEMRKELDFFTEEKSFIYQDKRKTTDCWAIKVGSIKCLYPFYKYLYEGATIYMKRKFDKFNNYFKERGSETIIS